MDILVEDLVFAMAIKRYRFGVNETDDSYPPLIAITQCVPMVDGLAAGERAEHGHILLRGQLMCTLLVPGQRRMLSTTFVRGKHRAHIYTSIYDDC